MDLLQLSESTRCRKDFLQVPERNHHLIITDSSFVDLMTSDIGLGPCGVSVSVGGGRGLEVVSPTDVTPGIVVEGSDDVIYLALRPLSARTRRPPSQ